MYDRSPSSRAMLLASYGHQHRAAGTLTPAQPAATRASGWSPLWMAVSVASVGASAYHGTRRNDSVGWGIWWGLMGFVAPIITPAVALGQGFGQRKR